MSKQRLSKSDRLFLFFIDAFLALALLLVLLPVAHIVAASFSAPEAVATGRVTLYPIEFSLKGYATVFKDPTILSGFYNTFFYTICGTAINIFMTVIAAYALSRKNLFGRGVIMFMFTLTMVFDGGLIPSYLLNASLGLVNTRWALLLPGAINVYNLIIARTFFQTNVPEELFEAAAIDGCGHFRFLASVALPLSKPILAVLTLYYAVAHWNSYFSALIYLSDRSLFPLQIVLREILVLNTIDPSVVFDPALAAEQLGMSELLKYSLIIVSSVPFMVAYPFVSKHFVKGALVGAVKG
jgi:ABC-type glycerol-3-phosphate transport system permease component